MSSVTATLAGVDRFAATLGEAADRLGDLEPAGELAADDVLGFVDAPRDTGRLESTVDAVADALGFTLTAGGTAAPYGPIVHLDNPFLTDALAAREAAVVDKYTDYVADVVDHIQGD